VFGGGGGLQLERGAKESFCGNPAVGRTQKRTFIQFMRMSAIPTGLAGSGLLFFFSHFSFEFRDLPCVHARRCCGVEGISCACLPELSPRSSVGACDCGAGIVPCMIPPSSNLVPSKPSASVFHFCLVILPLLPQYLAKLHRDASRSRGFLGR
jgi:hypothetical protein